MADNLARSLRFMLVTDDSLLAGRDPAAVAEAAIRGGVTAVQLRLKQVPARPLVALARRLEARLAVPVIVNDRADVAAAAGTGVHLGPEDLPADLARAILPPDSVIGVSVGSTDEVPNGAAASYWGVGPWRGTTTKADAGAALGADGLRRIVLLAGGRPCVAIGGVRPADVGPIASAGAAGIAVSSGLLGASDVEAAAREYARAITQAFPDG